MRDYHVRIIYLIVTILLFLNLIAQFLGLHVVCDIIKVDSDRVYLMELERLYANLDEFFNGSRAFTRLIISA